MDSTALTHLRGEQERVGLPALHSERRNRPVSRDRTLPTANLQHSQDRGENTVGSVGGLPVQEDTHIIQQIVPHASDAQLESHSAPGTHVDTAMETDEDDSRAADDEIVLLWNMTYNMKLSGEICPKRKNLAAFLAANPHLAEYCGQDTKIKAARNFDQLFNNHSKAGSANGQDAHNSSVRGNNGALSSNASNVTLNSDEEAETVRKPRKRQRKISSALKDPSFETEELPMSLQDGHPDFAGYQIPPSSGYNDPGVTTFAEQPVRGELVGGQRRSSSQASSDSVKDEPDGTNQDKEREVGDESSRKAANKLKPEEVERVRRKYPPECRIEGNYRRRGWYYPGKVHKVTDDGMIEVHYDDGGRERLAEQYLRPENAIIVGDRVKGNFKKKGRWYPGVIISQDDNEGSKSSKFLIKYDDGAREWLPQRYLRVLLQEEEPQNGEDGAQRERERREKERLRKRRERDQKRREENRRRDQRRREEQQRREGGGDDTGALVSDRGKKRPRRNEKGGGEDSDNDATATTIATAIATTATAIATATGTATTTNDDDVDPNAPYAEPIQLADGRMMCPVCSRTFANNYNLQRHMPHCPGEYDPDGLIARRKSRNRSRVSETGAEGPLPRNRTSVFVSSAELQAEKEKVQGKLSANATFWNCKECDAPNLQDDFNCSKCSARRPREVKAIKRLGPDEMRSPYERRPPGEYDEDEDEDEIEHESAARQGKANNSSSSSSSSSSIAPPVRKPRSRGYQGDNPGAVCPDCGKGFENIGNMNRHLPYCPALKSGQTMTLSPSARMGDRNRERGDGGGRAGGDGQADVETQPYRPPRVGERFQATVSGHYGTGVGRTAHYAANFSVSEKQRDDRKRHTGEDNLFIDDDMEELMAEAAKVAGERTDKSIEVDEWLLDVNASSCNAPALFKEGNLPPSSPLVNIDSHSGAPSSSSSSSSSSEHNEEKKESEKEDDPRGGIILETENEEKEEKEEKEEEDKLEKNADTVEKPAAAPTTNSTSISSSTQTVAHGGTPLEAVQMAEHLTRMFHANKCPYEKGHCPASKFCAPTKVLWRHAGRCQDPTCKYDLCRQAKRALDHYRICGQKAMCPCCSRVDEELARRRHQAEETARYLRKFLTCISN